MAEAELPSHTPTGFTTDAFQRAVEDALGDQLADARAAVERSGRGYLGVEEVIKQDPFSAPRTRQKRNVGEAANARPRFLGSTPE